MTVQPKDIQGWKPKAKNYYKTAYKGVRGSGSIVVKIKTDGVKELYYRYKWIEGEEETIPSTLLGVFSYSGKTGITLAAAKELAAPMMEKRLEGINVIALLKQGKSQKVRQGVRVASDVSVDEEGLHPILGIKVIPGSFGHMAAVYSEYQKNEKADHERVITTVVADIVKPWPKLMEKQGRDVTLLELKKIIARVLSRGTDKNPNKRQADLVRTYMSGMYREAMNYDGDPMNLIHSEEEVFKLDGNLALSIKKQEKRTNASVRHLSIEELRFLWHGIQLVSGSVVTGYVRFMIAVAGQRLVQVVREPWASYDLDKEQLKLKDLKQSHEKFQNHIVYFNDVAMEILESMKMVSGHCIYPFPGFSRNGQRINPESFLGDTSTCNACKKVLALMRIELNPVVESFAPKDFRRSCKTMMLDKQNKMNISKLDSNHVHNHGERDVSAVNYDCNDYELEKRETMVSWGKFLRKEVINKKPKGWKKIAA